MLLCPCNRRTRCYFPFRDLLDHSKNADWGWFALVIWKTSIVMWMCVHDQGIAGPRHSRRAHHCVSHNGSDSLLHLKPASFTTSPLNRGTLIQISETSSSYPLVTIASSSNRVKIFKLYLLNVKSLWLKVSLVFFLIFIGVDFAESDILEVHTTWELYPYTDI